MSALISNQHNLFTAFAKQVAITGPTIERALLSRKYKELNINSTSFTVDEIYNFIKNIHQPFTLQYEGGWADNPNDNGGATMRGVTLKTFKRNFKKIFDIKQYGIPDDAYSLLYNKIEATNWDNDDVIAKDFLYTLFTQKAAFNLFVSYYYCNDDNGCGLQLAVYDPYIAFLIIDKIWMSGGYAWSNGISNGHIYDAAKAVGYTGPTAHYAKKQFVNWLGGLNTPNNYNSPQLAGNLITAFTNHAYGIVSKNDTQRQFLGGWLARFIGRPKDTRDNMFSIRTKWINFLQSLGKDAKYEGYINSYKTLQLKSVEGQTIIDPMDNNSGLAPVILPLAQHDYQSNVTSTQRVLKDVMQIADNGQNLFGGKQLIFDSDRIILNSKNFLILSSKNGTAIASAGPVNVDSGEEVIINPAQGFYVGANKENKYDSMILGNKLIDILENLFIELTHAKVVTPSGEAWMSNETQSNLQKLIQQLGSTLSTGAFLDSSKFSK